MLLHLHTLKKSLLLTSVAFLGFPHLFFCLAYNWSLGEVSVLHSGFNQKFILI
jgi:hypothetical protein